MTDALLLFAISLAVFRVWRLLGRDDITEGFWRRIPGKLGEGWRCGWCLGSHLALLSTYLVHVHLVALSPHWLLWAVACAALVGFLTTIDEKLHE